MDTAVVLDEVIVNASEAVSFTNTPLVNSFIDSSCPSFKYTVSLKNESLVAVLTVVAGIRSLTVLSDHLML